MEKLLAAHPWTLDHRSGDNRQCGGRTPVTTYSILHDTDTPKTFRKNSKTGVKEEIVNPAWTTSKNILEAVEKQLAAKTVRLAASKVHFEVAFFDTALTGEKPYTAARTLQSDDERRKVVTDLLRGLVDHAADLPAGVIEWSEIGDLEAAFGV